MNTKNEGLLKKSGLKGFFSDVLVTNLATILGKSTGFFIPLLIAFWFGVSQETDLYFFTNSLLFFLILSTGEAPALTLHAFLGPFLNKSQTSTRVFNNLLIGSLILFIPFSLLLIVILSPLLKYTTAYDSTSIEFITNLFLFGVPYLIFSLASHFYTTLLNIHKKFFIPAAAPLLRGLIILSVMAMFKSSLGIKSIPIGYSIGEGVLLCILIFSSIKKLPYRLQWNFQWNEFATFFSVTFFQLLAGSVALFNPLMDRFFVSYLPAGNISILEYASLYFYVLYGALVAGFAVVLTAYWAPALTNLPQKNNSVRPFRAALWSLCVSIPICGLFFLFRHPITQTLFSFGTVTGEEALAVGNLGALYIFILIPIMVRLIFHRVLLILKKTKILLIVAVIEMSLNLLGNFALMKNYGLVGIILSTIVSLSIGTIILGLVVKKHKTSYQA